MAYFSRRRDSQVTVYYYDRKLKRPVPLPRSETEHLDSLPDADVQQWVEGWEERGGVGRQRSRRRAVLGADALAELVDAYLADHKATSDRALREDTLADYRRDFDRFILPFFVGEKGCKDVRKWHLWTDEFPSWLAPRLGADAVRKVSQNLTRFGAYLQRRRILVQGWLLPKRRNKKRRKAPLVRRMDPTEPLRLAQDLVGRDNPRWALAVLLGYFGSLRPEELFALETGDFLYSDAARTRAKSWAGFQKAGLGSGLSLIVDRTLLKKEPVALTKTHYARGVVNVFSPEAARLIAPILREHKPGRLFPGTRWHNNGEFEKYVKAVLGLNAQDLRRASSNYLGKTRGVDPFTLQDHLRHREMSTTLLYCRDPADRGYEDAGTPNYDDVG